MVPNPFIELFRSPIATLTWVGYFLLMAGVVFAAVPWAIRQAGTLIARYYTHRASDSWWAFGDRRQGYIPPLSWLARAFGVLFVLAIAAWALASMVYLVGGPA